MYKRSSYSNLNSRAKRQFRAADQQRDTTQVVINSDVEVTCGNTMVDTVGNGDAGDFRNTGCAAINVFDVLRKGEFFNQFATLYDQVRIDCIRAKIQATSWTQNTNNNNQGDVGFAEYDTPRSYTICTAWDRSGLGSDQYIKVNKRVRWMEPVAVQNEDEEWVVERHERFKEVKDAFCVVGSNITTYSSAMTKSLGPGNAYQIVRQLYPSSVMEKSQYVNTNDLVVQGIHYGSENKYVTTEWRNVRKTAHLRLGMEDDAPTEDVQYIEPMPYNIKESYPTNLLSSPSIKFKPVLLINVLGSSNEGPIVIDRNILNNEEDAVVNIGINKIKPVTFNIEFEICVTFRGLRYVKQI